MQAVTVDKDKITRLPPHSHFRGIYCHHLFILLITIIPAIIQRRIERILCCNIQQSTLAIVTRVSGLR